VKISLSVTNFSWPGGTADIAARLAEIARIANATGLDTLWVADHPMQSDPASSPDEPMLDAYTTLGMLAGLTGRIRLGTLVSCASFRAPALLIKAVTTLDVLSGGRAWLGVGAGYNEAEARAMGVDLPPIPERFDRLIDTLELAGRLWRDDRSRFDGRSTVLEGPVSSPLPLSRPRPRILVGGVGERRTLPLVARYADACNLFDLPDGGDGLRRQLGVIARECAKLGRPYAEIETTVTTALREGESESELIERCRRFAGLGLTHVVLIARGRAFAPADVELLGRAAERLSAE
jgi:alkanesulfonate monooxygenase SsuD/methylene tetrahydromethanopterin reductase-like flavin-dependent oxidoreductase (luciferase family)